MAYSKILTRIRSEKTNYRKRKTMLMGKRDFISVNITNENAQVQILKPVISGDKVLASAHSRFLIKDVTHCYKATNTIYCVHDIKSQLRIY